MSEQIESLRRAIAHAYSGSAEHGSFLRNSGGEYVPSPFLLIDQVEADLTRLTEEHARLQIDNGALTRLWDSAQGVMNRLLGIKDRPPVADTKFIVDWLIERRDQAERALQEAQAEAADWKLSFVTANQELEKYDEMEAKARAAVLAEVKALLRNATRGYDDCAHVPMDRAFYAKLDTLAPPADQQGPLCGKTVVLNGSGYQCLRTVGHAGICQVRTIQGWQPPYFAPPADPPQEKKP